MRTAVVAVLTLGALCGAYPLLHGAFSSSAAIGEAQPPVPATAPVSVAASEPVPPSAVVVAPVPVPAPTALQPPAAVPESEPVPATVAVSETEPAIVPESMPETTVAPAPDPVIAEILDGGKTLGKQEVRRLLDQKEFNNLTTKAVDLPLEEKLLHVETSLDVGLQKYLLDQMDRKHARYIGIVVLEGDTGRTLAMAGFDKTGAVNPCLLSEFPSASIFKIVTAASAVEQCGLTANTPVHFNGNKYTLYTRQLKNLIDKHTTTVSFAQSFAQSVNPVFGKIGESNLGKPMLEKYAGAFGFNHPLDFDLPLEPSRFRINDDPYHWAELASGLNRDTTISPLHGAVMVSAVLNNGRMVAPALVDRIVDDGGKELYRWQPSWERQAMSARSSAILSQLMHATIDSGTARNFFRGYRRDEVLSRLEIGGKTGSIDNATHDTRYDWFVGFAKENEGGRQVVVAVVVAHEKLIGTRAGQYARMAMQYYFRDEPGEKQSSPRQSLARVF